MTRLSPGDPAPDFTLPNDAGTLVALSDYAGGRVVVYFYPAALTPGCTTQAVDFTAAYDELEQQGLAVLGISPDPVAKLARFREQESIRIPLLSDPDKQVLRAYGAYGLKKLYGKEVEGVIRSTFVVDVDDDGHGVVSQAQYNVRAKGHVAKLMKELGVDAPVTAG